MNIFYLDKNPMICARYHCDKHVVKMILEYTQLLCTAHRVLTQEDHDERGLYRVTHVNHPCAIWVRKSGANYRWLYRLLTHLHIQYELRFYKKHKSKRDGLFDKLAAAPEPITRKARSTPVALCVPSDCVRPDPVDAYRAYYILHKQHIAYWRHVSLPFWYVP